MAVRTGVLGRVKSTGAGTFTLGPVPAGRTWIVKDWFLTYTPADTQTATVSAFSADGSIQINPIPFTSLGAGSGFELNNVNIVLGPGDYVHLVVSAAGFNLWLSGVSLIGVLS